MFVYRIIVRRSSINEHQVDEVGSKIHTQFQVILSRAMTKLNDVIGTAFIVAEFRSLENVERNPLYLDPIVPLFLSDQTRQAADRIAAGFPPSQEGVRLRTRYFDDRLDAQLFGGCRQVIILGAGLDTRGVRKRLPNVTYFEIDDADILNFKQMQLTKAGINAQVVLIPGNYVNDDLRQLLGANGFEFELPTYVIWEGNTMYLNRQAVLKVLTDLRSNLDSFSISFDYVNMAVIADATGDEKLSSFVKRFADMGAAWSFGIDDLNVLASDVGLSVIDGIKIVELFRSYWPERQIDSEFYDNYALCTLATR